MLSTDFYLQPTHVLAKALLGKELVRRKEGVELVGRIVEVEAYHEDGDPACHAFAGKTPRNQVMFGPPGHLYVYFIYGMHCCMNVVTEAEGVGAAVLIRALEPLHGLPFMARARPKAKNVRGYANGPGKACQAFAVTQAENGMLLQSQSLFLREPTDPREETVARSPRIGITKAAELPWRYFFADNPYVSASKWNSRAKVHG